MDYAQIARQLEEEQVPCHRIDPEKVEKVLEHIRILFFGYCQRMGTTEEALEHIEGETYELFRKYLERMDGGEEKAKKYSQQVMESLPRIKSEIVKDIQKTYENDPAAKSLAEIPVAYPGIIAILIYRIAHVVNEMDLDGIARAMSNYAKSVTGIDIHPGAKIGHSFFIDHGTGVVIGQTAEIGNHVTLYHGVTLGMRTYPTDEEGNLIRGSKRHPTLENGVTVFAGSHILGGDTVIGEGATIAAGSVVTKSVPAHETFVQKRSSK